MPTFGRNPGDLRERVELQSSTRTKDGGGGRTLSWATYDTVWARVRPVSSRERFVADQTGARTTHEVTLRTHATLDAKHRIVWETKVLRIVGDPVNADERGAYVMVPTVHEPKESA